MYDKLTMIFLLMNRRKVDLNEMNVEECFESQEEALDGLVIFCNEAEKMLGRLGVRVQGHDSVCTALLVPEANVYRSRYEDSRFL